MVCYVVWCEYTLLLLYNNNNNNNADATNGQGRSMGGGGGGGALQQKHTNSPPQVGFCFYMIPDPKCLQQHMFGILLVSF